MLVPQQLPSHLPLPIHHLFLIGILNSRSGFDIFAVVVISQNAVHTVFSPQTCQRPDMRIEFRGLYVLQIAGKEYDICLLRIDAIHIAFKQCKTTSVERTHMGIGELNDFIPIESGRQVFHINIHMPYFKATEPNCCTVNIKNGSNNSRSQTYKTTNVSTAPMEPAIQ